MLDEINLTRDLDFTGGTRFESLPHISTTTDPNENRQRIAVGAENLVAATVAVDADFSRDSQSTAVTLAAISQQSDFATSADHKHLSANEKHSPSTSNGERSKIGLARMIHLWKVE